ncbi:MAG: hypothetical protein ACP5L5_10165 [Vulcanisaeta sp.]|uniref:hypothetical protein n=1 Tax=Vulcanisaeta sp. TaxID=2020871 RepID=UPI003D0E9055
MPYGRIHVKSLIIIAILSIIINSYMLIRAQLGINNAVDAAPGEINIGNDVLHTYRSEAPLNVTVYVIGGKALFQDLINVGLNSSLIKPVSLNQLSELPDNSVVVIDWSVIRNSVVAGDPGSYVELNLTSPNPCSLVCRVRAYWLIMIVMVRSSGTHA